MQDFVEIPGFPHYLINVNGDVYSLYSRKILSTPANSRGYKMVRLHENGKQRSLLLHRLLAFVFLDLPSLESELEVDHDDRDKSNNKLSNLKILTNYDHRTKTILEMGHKRKQL